MPEGINKYYILRNGEPVEATLLEWAKWFEGDKTRIIEHTRISDDVLISTVFLGFDHGHGNHPKKLFFETMIFGGPLDQECWRYATLGEAKIGHFNAVRQARGGSLPDQTAT
jgi:hypothetical protein